MTSVRMIQDVLAADPLRMAALAAVAALALPDGWIAAGFVRDAVWDHLHGYGVRPPANDVDVVWLAPTPSDAAADRAIERRLRARLPGLDWSVKDQGRMHRRNGDMPYVSVADAMRHWPETATAVAARLDARGVIEINAPCGLDDLVMLRLAPTAAFAAERKNTFCERVSAKRWLELYPRLVLAGADPAGQSHRCCG